MGEKSPRWESEMWNTIQPNPRACETCMFRPSVYNGLKLDWADTVNCQIYEHPESKPHTVLWDGAEYESYEAEA
jgi:hypothetical protein